MDGRPKEAGLDVKNVEWLREQVVDLFVRARSVADPDVASCTKLAELLFKLLPKGASGQVATDAARELAEHRRRVLESGAPPV